MIELASIVKSAMSPSEFFAGQKLAEGRGVTIAREDSVWRGEHNVTATVREADACCTVGFNLSGDHIKNCRCDCHRMETVDPVTGLRGRLRGLCRHGVAAVLAYTTRTAIRPEQPVTTSFASKMLLQKY